MLGVAAAAVMTPWRTGASSLRAGESACQDAPAKGSASPRRDVAWLDEVQQAPRETPAAQQPPPEDVTLRPLLVDEQGRPIRSGSQWNQQRAQRTRRWLDMLGALKLPRPQPVLKVLEEDRPSGCIRRLVRYQSEPGIDVEGYLLLPEKLDGPVPGVVALHSTVDHTIRQPAGLEGPPEKHFGLDLTRRGMVVFCPRCFLWHDEADYATQVKRFQARHPRSRGMAKMLWDAMRGLDILCALEEVDPERLGAVGHSLGAKESLYLAALDPRVKAAVSSEGGVGRSFSNWDAPWYLGAESRADDFDFQHHELLALTAPRAMLIVGGDSADGARSWPYVEAALEVYRLYDPRPRLGLFNHAQGHAVPPKAQRRIYEWLEVYL
jgi:dienelactone hydrolase